MDLAKIRKKAQESGEKKPGKKPAEKLRKEKVRPVSLKEDYPPFEEDLEEALISAQKPKAESEPKPRLKSPRPPKPKEKQEKPEPVSELPESTVSRLYEEETEPIAGTVFEDPDVLPDVLEEIPEISVEEPKLPEPKEAMPRPVEEAKTAETTGKEARPAPKPEEALEPAVSGAAVDAQVSSAGDGIIELLTFNLAGEEYAFRVMDVEEILRPQKFAKVPKTADFIIGITSLRGKIIPLMDLKKRLLLRGNTPKTLQRILILKGPKGSIGALVDKVIDVIRIPENAMVNPPSHLAESVVKFIEAVSVSEGRFISVVRVDEALNFSITGGNS